MRLVPPFAALDARAGDNWDRISARRERTWFSDFMLVSAPSFLEPQVVLLYPNAEEAALLRAAQPTEELPLGKGDAFALGLTKIEGFCDRATCCVTRAQFSEESTLLEQARSFCSQRWECSLAT